MNSLTNNYFVQLVRKHDANLQYVQFKKEQLATDSKLCTSTWTMHMQQSS